ERDAKWSCDLIDLRCELSGHDMAESMCHATARRRAGSRSRLGEPFRPHDYSGKRWRYARGPWRDAATVLATAAAPGFAIDSLPDGASLRENGYFFGGALVAAASTDRGPRARPTIRPCSIARLRPPSAVQRGPSAVQRCAW